MASWGIQPRRAQGKPEVGNRSLRPAEANVLLLIPQVAQEVTLRRKPVDELVELREENSVVLWVGALGESHRRVLGLGVEVVDQAREELERVRTDSLLDVPLCSVGIELDSLQKVWLVAQRREVE